MTKYKISICFITYNNPKSVINFFESYKKQQSSFIEILIRDDSPNIDTKHIVEKYSRELVSPVKYYSGEKSKVGGYDKALLFLTCRAGGDYVWWFGDDLFAEGSISRVLQAVDRQEKFSFIWLNSTDITNSADKGFDLGGDRVFTSPGEIFKIDVGLLGFPSATIVRRELISSRIADAEKFIGTALTAFYFVLCAITSAPCLCLYIQKACLLSYPKPPGEARWYDSFEVHGLNYTRISSYFTAEIDRVSYRQGIAGQFGRVWRAVIYERASGYETGFGSRSPKLYKMTTLYWSYPEFYLAFPLMLLPRAFLGLLMKIYNMFRSR